MDNKELSLNQSEFTKSRKLPGAVELPVCAWTHLVCIRCSTKARSFGKLAQINTHN